ncbi:hypothetical protein WDU94_007736, partial [Cyamophila willieti]
EIKPSEYQSQIELPTKERYDTLVKLSKRKQIPLEGYSTSSTFSVLPGLLVFQNIVPGQTYKANVKITNVKLVSLSASKLRTLSTYVYLGLFFEVLDILVGRPGALGKGRPPCDILVH